jgi:hypothetical protein
MAEEGKWYQSPQGIVAAATIATMILGFFYVRERQMWENSNRIQSIEQRGDKAIASFATASSGWNRFYARTGTGSTSWSGRSPIWNSL